MERGGQKQAEKIRMYDFSSKILHWSLGYIFIVEKRKVTRPILIMPDKKQRDRQSEDDEYDKLIDRTYRKADRNTS